MTLKIVSDGTLIHTYIRDAETGEILEGVTSLDWHIDGNAKLATATLTLCKVPVELTVDGALVGERLTITPLH